MKVVVIWGFLGSGKTTWINYFLSSFVSSGKIAILENESGKESVDGTLLRNKNYVVKDLNSGCICCSLRSELPLAIQEIEQEIQPDILLIEPSGIASLEEIIRIPLFKADLLVALVDVQHYPVLMKLNADYYRRQFKLASVILLTKGDLAGEEAVGVVRRDITAINPVADLICDYRLLRAEQWDLLLNKQTSGFSGLITYLKDMKTPIYRKETVSVHFPVDPHFFDYLFTRLNSSSCLLLRAKGFVQDMEGGYKKVDYVCGTVSVGKMPDTFHIENCFLSFWWTGTENISEIVELLIHTQEIPCQMEQLHFKKEEVYAYLGYGDSVPDSYMSDFINRLVEEALSVCRPRFGYRMVIGAIENKKEITLDGQLFTPESILVHCLKGSEWFLLMVASVGSELDRWMEEKRHGNDVMETFIADALGSAIVEAVVEWGLLYMEKLVTLRGLKISNSYSPGYCGWNVSEQQLFFSLLPDHFCGITLTDSSLMLPIKSVSALVGVGAKLEKKAYGCAICRKKDCYKRKADI